MALFSRRNELSGPINLLLLVFFFLHGRLAKAMTRILLTEVTVIIMRVKGLNSERAKNKTDVIQHSMRHYYPLPKYIKYSALIDSRTSHRKVPMGC